MEDFYITVQSDSSPDYFPSNTITNFRNQFSIPVRLDSSDYQVALAECSYVPSGIIIKKGELVCGRFSTGREFYAPRDYHEVEPMLKDMTTSLQVSDKNFQVEGDYVVMTKYLWNDFTKVFEYITDGESLNHHREKYLKRYKISPEDAKKYISFKFEIEFLPRIRAILGYDDQVGEYIHPIYGLASASNLYVYCNIVTPQRVGDSLVPLLRKMINDGKANALYTREFQHLQYIDVALTEFDSIHIYIRTEAGDPPSFKVGTFTATLHFRRRPF